MGNKAAHRNNLAEALILAIERLEELDAIALLLEEHARDSDVSRKRVAQIARLFGRSCAHLVEQLCEALEGRATDV